MAKSAASIAEIPGIGEKIIRRLERHFGSEDAIVTAMENLEIDRIAAVEGISERRAVRMVKSFLGDDPGRFLRTEKAVVLYADIIDRVKNFASTQYGRNKISLLHPTMDVVKMRRGMEDVMRWKGMAQSADTRALRSRLSRMKRLEEPKPLYDSSRVILTDSEQACDSLIAAGLNRYCRIAAPDESRHLRDAELIVYLYEEGGLDLTGLDNVVELRFSKDIHSFIPETVTSFFLHNLKTLEEAAALQYEVRRLRGSSPARDRDGDGGNALPDVKASALVEAVEMTRELVPGGGRGGTDGDVPGEEKKNLLQAAEEIREDLNRRIRDAVEYLNIAGGEILQLMSGGAMPLKLSSVLDGILAAGREELRGVTGVDCAAFLRSYPVSLDNDEIERVERQREEDEHIKAFERAAGAATRLRALRPLVEEEIREIFEFDYELALGTFALAYDLHPPVIWTGVEEREGAGRTGKGRPGYEFRGGLHMGLAPDATRGAGEIQYIDYHFGSAPGENVVLLTGANSGGKTTLMETLAQMVIMMHCGLPVKASSARLRPVEELHVYAQKRSMDAGAFEMFLRSLVPLIVTDTKKLILADELEAITELEAATRIISSFIEAVKESDSCAIIVTHMAREISRLTTVRVDGIEARGLDHDYNLVVDRTPRINRYARSTPELILKRLFEKSGGREKEIFGRMLEKFGE